MKHLGWNFGCAAAALALLGCQESQPETGPAKAGPGGGVTIELPEPMTVAAAPAPAAEQPPQPVETLANEDPPAPAPPAEAPPEATKVQAPSPKVEAPAPETPNAEAPPATETEEVRLPLPRATIARTIERIGYSCGSVASAARVEAAAGETAYKITCSSGDAYRASDRTGRFRFRKWGEAE